MAKKKTNNPEEFLNKIGSLPETEQRKLVQSQNVDGNTKPLQINPAQTIPLPHTPAPIEKPNPNQIGTSMNPEKLKFNSDGSVTISKYDPNKNAYSTDVFSKEEYRALLGQGNGFMSQRVFDARFPDQAALRDLSIEARNKEIERINKLREAQGILQQPSQFDETNLKSNVGKGVLAETGANAVQGAIVGGIAGAAVGGIGAIPGAIGGAIAGAAKGLIGSSKEEKRQAVTQSMATYTTARTSMNQIINALNQGQIDAPTAALAWNEQKMKVYAAERNLKELTSSNVQEFLSQGADELIKVEEFKRMIPIYEQKLQEAMFRPNVQALDTISQEVQQ